MRKCQKKRTPALCKSEIQERTVSCLDFDEWQILAKLLIDLCQSLLRYLLRPLLGTGFHGAFHLPQKHPRLAELLPRLLHSVVPLIYGHYQGILCKGVGDLFASGNPINLTEITAVNTHRMHELLKGVQPIIETNMFMYIYIGSRKE